MGTTAKLDTCNVAYSLRVSSPRSARTRERLLGAARHLLDEHGFATVTLEDVAASAGVSRQTVYLHFGSRGGLLASLARFVDEAIAPLDLFERMTAAPTAVAALDAGLDIHIHFEARVHVYARALQAIKEGDPAAQEAWNDRMMSRQDGVSIVVDRIVQEDLLADGWSRAEAIQFMCALTSVDMYDALVVQAQWSTKRYKKHLMEAVRGCLFRQGGPRHEHD